MAAPQLDIHTGRDQPPQEQEAAGVDAAEHEHRRACIAGRVVLGRPVPARVAGLRQQVGVQAAQLAVALHQPGVGAEHGVVGAQEVRLAPDLAQPVGEPENHRRTARGGAQPGHEGGRQAFIHHHGQLWPVLLRGGDHPGLHPRRERGASLQLVHRMELEGSQKRERAGALADTTETRAARPRLDPAGVVPGVEQRDQQVVGEGIRAERTDHEHAHAPRS